jgi:secondary thiamine-phosphate synthase enzyme
MKTHLHWLEIDTSESFNLHNITQAVSDLVAGSGIAEGIVAVTSQHTTTAITINEDEERLRSDIETYFAQLAPPDRPYLHNDIHLRDCDPDEPENAHAHLAAMLFGTSESVAIHHGQLQLGKWQSIMLVELDGPRRRRVSVQILGQ